MRFLILVVCMLVCGFARGQLTGGNVQLKGLDGREMSFEQVIREEGTVVVSFWATWCKPCQSELEALQELKDEWQGKFRVIAISVDDARASAKVKSLVKGRRWSFEVWQDANMELYKAFNLASIPFVCIVHNGVVVWKHSGYMPGDEHVVLEKALKYVEQENEK